MATNKKNFLDFDGLGKYDKEIKDYIGKKSVDKAKSLEDGLNYVHAGLPSHSESDVGLQKLLGTGNSDTVTMEGCDNETYGISLSGDGCVIWNPGDTYLLALVNEDDLGEDGESAVKFYVDNSGSIYKRRATRQPDGSYELDDYAYVTSDKTFSVSTISTSRADANNYKTTGYYQVVVTDMLNMPIANHGLLFVDFKVGTPYQLFIPDASNSIYKRTYATSHNMWNNWVNILDFYQVPKGCEVLLKDDSGAITLDADEVIAKGDIIIDDELKVDTVYSNKNSSITFEDAVSFRGGASFGSGDIIAEDGDVYASGGDVKCKIDETYHYLSEKANASDIPADNLIKCGNASSSANADDCIGEGLSYYKVDSEGSPYDDDGNILWVPWGNGTDYGHQFYMDDESTALFHRALASGDWRRWARIWDDDYHPGGGGVTPVSGHKERTSRSSIDFEASQDAYDAFIQSNWGYDYIKMGTSLVMIIKAFALPSNSRLCTYSLPFRLKNGSAVIINQTLGNYGSYGVNYTSNNSITYEVSSPRNPSLMPVVAGTRGDSYGSDSIQFSDWNSVTHLLLHRSSEFMSGAKLNDGYRKGDKTWISKNRYFSILVIGETYA